jgi:hypothetical protein
MTALSHRKSKLTFETADVFRFRGKLREVVIEAQPYTALIRLKGTRQRFEVSWAGIYNLAAKIAADRARTERKQRKAVA